MVTRTSLRSIAASLLLMALAATACTASTTLEQVDSAPSPTATAAEVSPVEPTAVPEAEPTAAATAEPAPSPTAVDSAETEPEFEAVDIATESILGLSNDGRFGYAGTTVPWSDPTPCDADSFASVGAFDVAAVQDAAPAGFGIGLDQTGDVRQMVFGEGTRVAFLSSCGPYEEPTTWLQRADLGTDGRIAGLGSRIDLQVADNESQPWVLGWQDEDLVEVRVIVEVDPDDFDTWLLERRAISTVDGSVTLLSQDGYYDDTGRAATRSYTAPGGQFSYREVDDPAGRLGCEGFGVAASLEVTDESGSRLALDENGPTFSNVLNMHFGPDQLVTWSSGCEGYTTAWVGRMLDDGTIADAHWIENELFTGQSDIYYEFWHYRLTDDGALVALGQEFDGGGSGEIRAAVYDLATDPQFVQTANPPVNVDRQNPLADLLGGQGQWLVGETLSTNPACGNATLYFETSGGLTRGLPATMEVDTIVDMDVSEARTETYGDDEYVSRTMVIQTECPNEYDGRRVWFATEDLNPQWGLYLEQADLDGITEVADVLSVTDELDDDGYFARSWVEVVLLDGSIRTVELTRVEYE